MSKNQLEHALYLLTKEMASISWQLSNNKTVNPYQIQQTFVLFNRIRKFNGLPPIQMSDIYISPAGLYIPMGIKLIK